MSEEIGFVCILYNQISTKDRIAVFYDGAEGLCEMFEPDKTEVSV